MRRPGRGEPRPYKKMRTQGIGHFDSFCASALRQPRERVRFPSPRAPLTRAERNLAGLGYAYGMGVTGKQATQSAASTAAMIAPATGPAAPFVLAAAGIVSLFSAIFGGSDPRKVPDTQAVESAQIALNQLWYQVSGEKLNGIEHAVVPGESGRSGIPIFTTSKYPNVPYGPAGNPDVNIDQAIANARAIVQEAASRMQRKESLKNSFFTTNGSGRIALLEQVKAARDAAAKSSVLGGASKSSVGLLALAGAAAYLLLA